MSVDIHAKLEVLPPYVGRYVFPIGRPIAGEDGAYHIVGEINSCGGTEEECKALAVLLTATVAGIAIISVHYHYLLTHSF